MALFFRGTSIEQDGRFSDKNKKLMRTMDFPDVYAERVDMKRVNFKVLARWVGQRLCELLGLEDDIVEGMVMSYLEAETVDPKVMQINLTGFLEDNTPVFMQELWEYLVDAQTQPGGVPRRLLEVKKEQMHRQRDERDRIEGELRRRGFGGDNGAPPHGARAPPPPARGGSGRPRSRTPPRRRRSRSRDRPHRHRRSRSRSRDRRHRRSRSRERRHRRSRSRERSRSRDRHHSRRHRSRSRSRSPRRHRRHHRHRSRSRSRSPRRHRRRRRRTPSESRSPKRRRSRSPKKEEGGEGAVAMKKEEVLDEGKPDADASLALLQNALKRDKELRTASKE